MKYTKVRWIHAHADEPIWIYAELDEDLNEIRKVEVFADGSKGYADKVRESGTTGLSIEPWPPLDEIAADPQFAPEEISSSEFEEIWAACIS